MNMNMNFTNNVGMLLLGIWLLISGLVALVPAIYFDGLRVIMAILALLAGIHEFYKEVQRSKRISKIRVWHNPDVTTR